MIAPSVLILVMLRVLIIRLVLIVSIILLDYPCVKTNDANTPGNAGDMTHTEHIQILRLAHIVQLI